VAYFDNETYYKKYLSRISSDQKNKLLPLIEETQENIGFLESSIIHARDLGSGKKTRSVIQRQQLQSYEFNERIRQVEPKDKHPLILQEEIVISVFFDIDKGFTFTYDDLDITVTDTDFARGKQNLHHAIYLRIEETVNAKPTAKIPPGWKAVIDRLLNNPNSLKK